MGKVNRKKTLGEVGRGELVKSRTEVAGIFREVSMKSSLEKKAFDALSRRLEPRHVGCKKCGGEGELSSGGSCGVCDGTGIVVEDADMRAIELVLSPKFPKTQVNVNADLEDVSVDELLGMIDEM